MTVMSYDISYEQNEMSHHMIGNQTAKYGIWFSEIVK